MRCSICNHNVTRVDEKAKEVICSTCVSKGHDFSKPKKTFKEPIILIEGG